VRYHMDLQTAARERGKEWEGAAGASLSMSYRGNEMAGELGECFEQLLIALELGASVGRACNMLKKLDREAAGMVGSTSNREALGDEFADVVITAHNAARQAGIDLNAAIVRKFNKTSEKLGFETRMVE
jgi:NTP pyrophosphatase (non-canonical NTP hydrolase)